jgi:RNA polymerase sigma-70 factor (ECF subfamily)
MALFRKKNYASHSDEGLMELVGRGEIPAFDELYARYSKRLLYYFYKMLGQDQERAQDFLHDLFLKIVERPELFAVERKFSTWIFSVAHNMCKNEYRRLRSRQTVDVEIDEMPAEAEGIIESIHNGEFARMLAMELDMLDEDQRTTFLLRYREGLSLREISEIIGCPEGTVKSRLFYTVRKLGERLQQFNPHRSAIEL